MGIYIRSMEMPRSCDVCDFAIELDERELGTHLYCGFPGIGVYVDDCVFSVHKDCPLIEIPSHGDLIDRSHLCDDSIGGNYGSGIRVYYAYEVEHAPVIIPASKED